MKQKMTAILGLLLLLATTDRGMVRESKSPTRFAVKVVGKGPPMILIPGLACSGAVWDETVARYQARYECHVVTLAGFAGQPAVADFSLEAVRKSLAAYIRDHKLSRPVVVGHSLGGYLALWLGAAEPELVGSLIVVDGLPCLGAAFNEKIDAAGLQKLAQGAQERLAKLSREDFLAQQKAFLTGSIRDRKHLEKAQRWCQDSDQTTVARAFGQLLGKDLRGDSARIRVPVLLLGAWSEEMTKFGRTREAQVKSYREQTSRIPRCKVVVAKEAGHFIMFDDPIWLFQQMDAFLAEK
jgi:pimeloyl-ACP methyl ester carboxylesterase